MRARAATVKFRPYPPGRVDVIPENSEITGNTMTLPPGVEGNDRSIIPGLPSGETVTGRAQPPFHMAPLVEADRAVAIAASGRGVPASIDPIDLPTAVTQW